MRLQKQFVADASHELKTPLTVITANAGLLEERCAGLPEEAKRWLSNINQECRDMRTLVESLLLLAKGDTWTKRKDGWKVFSFSDLVTEKLLIFEPLFYQAGKELRFEAADDVSVKGDASQLGKLVTVLLDNAVKYADGTGRVEVRLETAGRGRARLWVNSEGEPIPKEKRTLIFQRFYRDEKVRASRTGYGLGLAIAGGDRGKPPCGDRRGVPGRNELLLCKPAYSSLVRQTHGNCWKCFIALYNERLF